MDLYFIHEKKTNWGLQYKTFENNTLIAAP